MRISCWQSEEILHGSKLRQYLKSDVLKVGHHGSKYSSSSTFLSTVKPKYAVISVGKDNPYGHPAAITLSKLRSVGAEIFRTDEQGTITITSDGQTIKVDKKASAVKPQAPPSSSTSKYAYILADKYIRGMFERGLYDISSHALDRMNERKITIEQEVWEEKDGI